jgi:hypothetical protein
VSLKLYLVSFEFRTGGNYASLREHLRTLQAQQVLDRQWALRAKESADQLKEHLRGFVDPGDGITVVEVGEERASRRAMADLRGL